MEKQNHRNLDPTGRGVKRATSEVELALLDGVEEVRALPYQVGGEPDHGGGGGGGGLRKTGR